jgi:hypothetical protein
MDPKATLQQVLQAIVDGDRTEARMGLQALHDWLRHGGHMPTENDVAEICRSHARIV